MFEEMLRHAAPKPDDVANEFAPPEKTDGMSEPSAPAFDFTEEERALANTVFTDVLPTLKTQLASIRDLTDEKVVKRIVADAVAIQRAKQGLFSDLTEQRAEDVVKEVCAAFVAKTIAIPSLTVTPQDQVSFGFQPFTLDVGSWNYQPLSRELLVQVLRTEKQTVISGEEGGDVPARLEDYLVAKLIDFDEIDYDAHAELLYGLAGQVVTHLRSYLKDDENVRATLQGWSRDMAKAMLVQMRQNMWRTTTTYRVTLNAAFSELKPQAFDGSGKDAVRNFRKHGLVANAMQVFFHTHPHNGDPWYHGQRSFEIEPTSDSFALIRQAVGAGRSIWKPNTRYAKAGVILLDLQAERDAPRDLLPTTDPVRSEKLMTALDAVNARFGRGTLRPGGISQTTSWSTRANNRSPRYTTRISDLMEVRA